MYPGNGGEKQRWLGVLLAEATAKLRQSLKPFIGPVLQKTYILSRFSQGTRNILQEALGVCGKPTPDIPLQRPATASARPKLSNGSPESLASGPEYPRPFSLSELMQCAYCALTGRSSVCAEPPQLRLSNFKSRAAYYESPH